MIKKNISLGIDISGECISYALLAQEKSAIRVISAGKKQTPTGAIKDGNIVDAALVAKTLKQLINKKKYRISKTTVSLTANPSLAQIIELPEETPSNVGRFVHSEIKHSAILVGKEIQLDYCRLGLAGTVPSRVFVSATEKNKMAPLLKALSLAGISPETIEHPLAGWTRSLYEKHVKPKFKSNVLLVMVRGNVLNICVFRNTTFDFVRSIDVTALNTEATFNRCREEMKAVVEYYDIEFGGDEKIAWDCVLELPGFDDVRESIEKELGDNLGMNVCVCSNDSIVSDTPITAKLQDQSTTLTAVGLALNSLKITCPNVKTNLVPNEIKESRAAKKELLVLANAVAGILVAIFLFAAFASSQFDKTQEIVKERKQKTPLKLIETLISRQNELEGQITVLSEKKKLVDKVLEDTILINWPEVLESIRENVPAQLHITRVDSTNGFDVIIRGKALTPDAVNLFSRHLGDSEIFVSSSVKNIDINSNEKGGILYTVKCTIADRRRLHADAN